MLSVPRNRLSTPRSRLSTPRNRLSTPAIYTYFGKISPTPELWRKIIRGKLSQETPSGATAGPVYHSRDIQTFYYFLYSIIIWMKFFIVFLNLTVLNFSFA